LSSESERSKGAVQCNGIRDGRATIPDFAALHPGYLYLILDVPTKGASFDIQDLDAHRNLSAS
jgi:hypothetical protein